MVSLGIIVDIVIIVIGEVIFGAGGWSGRWIERIVSPKKG
jgi:hypothetical protein